MRIFLLVLSSMFAIAIACFSADSQSTDAGKKAEQRSCTPCHSMRLIDSQRLSSAAWAKEVDKMTGWGAIVPDRQLLIDYLSTQYSDSKPVPVPSSSGDSATPHAGSAHQN
jgi:hypothetical protein